MIPSLLNDRRPAGVACLVDKERLEGEFASEVERMREEARERQEKGLGDDGSGGRGKKRNLSQTIDEGFEADPNARRTDSRLARAGGASRKPGRKRARGEGLLGSRGKSNEVVVVVVAGKKSA